MFYYTVRKAKNNSKGNALYILCLQKDMEQYKLKNTVHNDANLPKPKLSSVGDRSGRNIPDMSINKS
jgi:hypothetical protein